MNASPPLDESRYARYARRILLACVLAVPAFFVVYVLLRRWGYWQMSSWVYPGMFVAAGIGFIAAAFRLSHALWASTQYVLGELMLTFFVAAIVSLGFIEWVKYDPTERRTEREQMVYTISIVAVTFTIFLSGSAWAWGVLRRAPSIHMHRVALLASGWSSSAGMLCLTGFLFLSVIFLMRGGLPVVFRTLYLVLIPCSLLVLPGVLIERKIRRALAAGT